MTDNRNPNSDDSFSEFVDGLDTDGMGISYATIYPELVKWLQAQNISKGRNEILEALNEFEAQYIDVVANEILDIALRVKMIYVDTDEEGQPDIEDDAEVYGTHIDIFRMIRMAAAITLAGNKAIQPKFLGDE